VVRYVVQGSDDEVNLNMKEKQRLIVESERENPHFSFDCLKNEAESMMESSVYPAFVANALVLQKSISKGASGELFDDQVRLFFF
jgi:hypothetical protein